MEPFGTLSPNSLTRILGPPESGEAGALAAKRLPLYTPTQDAVDLPKMVQVVCRFQADELLDRLPSAYLVDPIALHPPFARLIR